MKQKDHNSIAVLSEVDMLKLIGERYELTAKINELRVDFN